MCNNYIIETPVARKISGSPDDLQRPAARTTCSVRQPSCGGQPEFSLERSARRSDSFMTRAGSDSSHHTHFYCFRFDSEPTGLLLLAVTCCCCHLSLVTAVTCLRRAVGRDQRSQEVGVLGLSIPIAILCHHQNVSRFGLSVRR